MPNPPTTGIQTIHHNGTIRNCHLVPMQDRQLVITGKIVRTASILDEKLISGQPCADPSIFVTALRKHVPRVDIFTFADEFTRETPRWPYRSEINNAAVLELQSPETWLKEIVASDVKRNIRRAHKRGVITRICKFNNALAHQIWTIYNETPIRQGRHFKHYGKSESTVVAELSHLLHQSIFIGAFHCDQLIGFAKLIIVDSVASIVLILSSIKFNSLKPSNALVAGTVQYCHANCIKYLRYGQYDYFKKEQSSLSEFKHRHGFKKFEYPRYYIPLTRRGELFLKAGLHNGIKQLLPRPLIRGILKIRQRVLRAAADQIPTSARS